MRFNRANIILKHDKRIRILNFNLVVTKYMFEKLVVAMVHFIYLILRVPDLLGTSVVLQWLCNKDLPWSLMPA